MKSALVLTTMLIFTNSYAFTSKTIFTCINNDEVSVTSSLMPTGQRSNAATSTNYGGLASVDCQRVNSFWKMNGSQHCYSNKDAVFSFFGQMGTLKMKINNRLVFTICQATQSIQ